MWKNVIFFSLLGTLAMSSMASDHVTTEPLEGYWGGDRLQLVIEATQTRIEMDCASGTINSPLQLKKNGSFQALGTFVQHQIGGPQRADEAPALGDAHYVGKVKGEMMRLTILPAGAQTPQEFKLRKGVHIKLIRCL